MSQGSNEFRLRLMKQYATIQLTDEQLFYTAHTDPRYERKANRIEVPPTAQDWDSYRAAMEAFKVLERYEWMDWGGPDYGTEVREPEPRVTHEWLETTEEWLARCRALREEGIK